MPFPPLPTIDNGQAQQYAGTTFTYTFSFTTWPDVTSGNPILSGTVTPPTTGFTIGSVSVVGGDTLSVQISIAAGVAGQFFFLVQGVCTNGDTPSGSWPLLVVSPFIGQGNACQPCGGVL